jgi:hypothetical protein
MRRILGGIESLIYFLAWSSGPVPGLGALKFDDGMEILKKGFVGVEPFPTSHDPTTLGHFDFQFYGNATERSYSALVACCF